MRDGGQMVFALPRPGRTLKTLLIVLAALGLVQALLFNWIPGGERIFLELAYRPEGIRHWELWRLFTAGLLMDPQHPGHLIFTLFGLYFFAPDLERRWGPPRFLRFLVSSVIIGYGLSFAFDVAAGSHVTALAPPVRFGAAAAITAVAIAWSRANENMQVNLFFFLPMSGKTFFWITIAFCFVDIVWPGAAPEGAVAPFGGIVTGLLLGGTPSVVRELYLRAKLGVLRRQSSEVARPASSRAPGKRRAGLAPLRVVQGGMEDELRKRQPPKDKRYLN